MNVLWMNKKSTAFANVNYFVNILLPNLLHMSKILLAFIVNNYVNIYFAPM